jgi:hypothetical protein
MVAKNILDLLDNKPNANQFDFLNKKGIRQPKSVCPDSLHHNQENGVKPSSDVARHPPLHSNN